MDLDKQDNLDDLSLEDLKKRYAVESHSKAKMDLIEQISQNHPKSGDSFLIEQYRNEKDWSVRKRLIEAVSTGNIGENVQFFIDALGDSHLESKKTAIKLLGDSLSPNALKPLIDLLQYGKVDYYDSLISSIVKLSKSVSIDNITRFLEEGNIYIKKAIPIILGKIGDKEAEETLKSLLTDQYPEIRKNAVSALESLIDEIDEINVILKVLEDEDIEVKKEAIRILGKLGNERAIHPLIELLKDKNKDVRNETVKSLFKLLRDSDNFRILYNIIKKRNVNARREAIKILGMIGDNSKRTINILIRSLNSKDSHIRRRAFNSLSKIYKVNDDDSSQLELLSTILESLKAREVNIRKYCARLLGRIGNERVIEPLFTLLEDNKSGVRRAAINSLAKFGNKKVISIASQYLDDPNWRMRRSVVRLLVRISKETNLKEDSLEPLLKCLNDDDKYVKSWSIKALGNLKSIHDIEPFLSILENKDPFVRIAAIKALGRIGDKESIKPLSNALADDNWDVRKEAELSLKKIDPDWMKFL